MSPSAFLDVSAAAEASRGESGLAARSVPRRNAAPQEAQRSLSSQTGGSGNKASSVLVTQITSKVCLADQSQEWRGVYPPPTAGMTDPECSVSRCSSEQLRSSDGRRSFMKLELRSLTIRDEERSNQKGLDLGRNYGKPVGSKIQHLCSKKCQRRIQSFAYIPVRKSHLKPFPHIYKYRIDRLY